ncbi:Sphingosine-1-phosphate lyase [Hypsibius exemplaris]|uniref:Sphingosine-1-phosphate lyase 1 n=1 Tax=Hypsibius exemplaris TaxID=2072580 RepID=A0A1W0WPI7_HYPEX|nr:Sphingosine-1-phosphate lyase [Hypsibius exemplaris]
MSILTDNALVHSVDRAMKDWKPWQIVVASSLTALAGAAAVEFIFQDDTVYFRIKKFAMRQARRIPAVRDKIEKEFASSKTRIEHDMFKASKSLTPIRALPQHTRSAEDVLNLVKEYKHIELAEWNQLSGTVYCGTDDITQLVTSVYSQFAWSNPLHADVFPAVRQMEAEVIRMCCTLFNGDADTCGSMTSGGTESILMACKTYRDRAISRGIAKPIILVASTAHAAFDKAAEYLNIRIKHIPFDPVTCQVNIRAMEKAINRRTCVIVGSAPQYPHGVIDPIAELSALGMKHNVPVHVDCCLGGFLLPFMDKAGFPLAPFDFRLKGVTSISADTHKYACAPKGSSVIMYRNHSYIHHQYTVQPDWPGGIYASPSMSGSRVGASIATTWAVLLYIGEDGYVKATRDILTAARRIEAGIRLVPNLYVLGKPQVSVVSFASKDFNIYRLSDAMAKRGWNLNALQYPASVHICVTRRHTSPGVVEKFLQDIRDCTEEIMKDPGQPDVGTAAIYGMAQSVPDRSIVGEMAWAYLDTCAALPQL